MARSEDSLFSSREPSILQTFSLGPHYRIILFVSDSPTLESPEVEGCGFGLTWPGISMREVLFIALAPSTEGPVDTDFHLPPPGCSSKFNNAETEFSWAL